MPSVDVQGPQEAEGGSRGEQDVGGVVLQGPRRLRGSLEAPRNGGWRWGGKQKVSIYSNIIFTYGCIETTKVK